MVYYDGSIVLTLKVAQSMTIASLITIVVNLKE